MGKKLYDENQGLVRPSLYDMGSSQEAPISLKMYYLIEKYSKKYQIPRYIAYNVAFLETGYKGPFHWSYNPHQESFAGAVGPMQIMPKTGKWLTNGSTTKSDLKMDIELNVSLSMKLLRQLHDQYNNWGVVCGWYNTGRPVINEYGFYCQSNKDYRSKWIKYKEKTPN